MEIGHWRHQHGIQEVTVRKTRHLSYLPLLFVFLRIDKFTIMPSPISKAVVTDNWIVYLGQWPWSLRLAHQSDVSIALIKSSQHLVSHNQSHVMKSLQLPSILRCQLMAKLEALSTWPSKSGVADQESRVSDSGTVFMYDWDEMKM